MTATEHSDGDPQNSTNDQNCRKEPRDADAADVARSYQVTALDVDFEHVRTETPHGSLDFDDDDFDTASLMATVELDTIGLIVEGDADEDTLYAAGSLDLTTDDARNLAAALLQAAGDVEAIQSDTDDA